MTTANNVLLAKTLLALASELDKAHKAEAVHEAGMIKANLLEIIEIAEMVNGLIQPGQPVEAWVAEKVTMAYSHLCSIKKYLKHEDLIKSDHIMEHGGIPSDNENEMEESEEMEEMEDEKDVSEDSEEEAEQD